MNKIETNKITLLYPSYPNIQYDISKELYRGELYCNLLKLFNKSCLENLKEEIFSHKKNAHITITNLLASWFFTLYQYYDFKDDPFYPTNYNYTDILVKTLQDYCSLSNIDYTDKINNIVNDLLYNYSIILQKLNEYNIVPNNIVPNNIVVTTITQKRHNENISFSKLILNKNYTNYSNRLNNIINNIIIPYNQYNNIKNKYNDINNIDDILWIIIYRYQLLSSNNNQLAVLPHILNKMTSEFNLSVECFASAINGTLSHYCSLYYDVEKYFGSIGSFFQMIPIRGTYSFNPPYQFDIISNGINHIINIMNNSNILNELCFIITIPIWDIEGKKYMKSQQSENNNDKINYEDFNIMTTIKQSIYFRGLRMVSKNDFTYFNHNFHLYKNKTIQNTYVIIMSNYNCNYIEKINTYDFYNKL